jgi:hypothetical protein
MTSILFSRSRRTASIRSGRAGGLADELAGFFVTGAKSVAVSRTRSAGGRGPEVAECWASSGQ